MTAAATRVGGGAAPAGAPSAADLVVHNGVIVPAGQAMLPVTTQGLHYGTGAFEGIRANPDGAGGLALFRAADHYARLHRSCRLLRIDLRDSPDRLVELTVELLQRQIAAEAAGAAGAETPAGAETLGGAATASSDGVGPRYLRPIAHKLALLPGSRPGVGLSGVSDSYSIVAFRLGDYAAPGGLRCAISSWTRPPRQSIPAQAKVTGGYVNSALAADEARAAGYDDAILLNSSGGVAEASTANVVLVVDGQLRTPPASADLLPGITRDSVSALAYGELGLRTAEVEVSPFDLLNADEVFLTGTGLGVAPVVEIGGRVIGDGKPGPVTGQLQELYRAALRGELPHYRHWLTPVPAPTAGEE